MRFEPCYYLMGPTEASRAGSRGVDVSTRIFLLSPASVGGRRAQLLLSGRSTFPLAAQLSAGEAAPLWEVFTFLSGLYFRGKHAYASAFASPPAGVPGSLVITSNRGLLRPEEPVTAAD